MSTNTCSLDFFAMRQARGSCASFVFGFVTFMSIGGFPSFVEDMKVSRISEKGAIGGLENLLKKR